MKISTKFYHAHAIIFLLFSCIILALYALFNVQFQHYVDDVIIAKAAQKKSSILAPIIQHKRNFKHKEVLFKKIHKDILTEYQLNPQQSLGVLKEKSIAKYHIYDTNIEIFLINKNHVIYETTDLKDLGLDISKISKKDMSSIDVAFNNDKINFSRVIGKDPLDDRFKLYSYAKVDENIVLEMSFSEKEQPDNWYINNLENYFVVRKDIDNNYAYFSHNHSSNISSKKNKVLDKKKVYANRVTFTKNNTDNPIAQAFLKQETILISTGNKVTVYANVNEAAVNEDYYNNIIVKFDIDISQQKIFFKTITYIFIIMFIVSILLFIIVCFFIHGKFVAPINLIINNLKEDKELKPHWFDQNSEFEQIAKVHNDLRDKRKTYTDSVSFDQGEKSERERIAFDLHDDIGSKLLHLSLQEGSYGEYARQTLQDLRTLTHALNTGSTTLENLLADLRYQLSSACDNADIAFDFIIDNVKFSANEIIVQAAVNVNCIINEIIKNAIQLPNTKNITIMITEYRDYLTIVIKNDGDKTDLTQWKKGLSTGSTERRVNQLSGKISWISDHNSGIECQVHIQTPKLYNLYLYTL